MILFGAAAAMYRLHYPLHLEGLTNECCFFALIGTFHRGPPNTRLKVTVLFGCMGADDGKNGSLDGGRSLTVPVAFGLIEVESEVPSEEKQLKL